MRRTPPLALLAIALAACEAGPPDGPAAGDACGALGYQGTVGTPLALLSLPAELNDRIVRPGEAVTQDFRPDRINFELDENDVVERVTCG